MPSESPIVATITSGRAARVHARSQRKRFTRLESAELPADEGRPPNLPMLAIAMRASVSKKSSNPSGS